MAAAGGAAVGARLTRIQLSKFEIKKASTLISLFALLSAALSVDVGNDLVTLPVGAALGAEALAGKLDGGLLLLLISGFDHFHHLALVGGETADLRDDGADGSNTGVESALAVASLMLLGVGCALELGHDETLVHTNVDTTLHQLLHHLVTLK